MLSKSLYQTFQRYRTLQTDVITSLPIVVLMPHSACNCKCVMCDIWKDNKNLKQLTKEDVTSLIYSLKKLNVQTVTMSGGEALLNQHFFKLCEILQKEKIKVSLLSTGLLLKKNADKLLMHVNDIIVSLDGNETIHDEIRNIPHAYHLLKDGVRHLHNINPAYKITGRTVIHRLNFRQWPAIIQSAVSIGLNQISFLPADVSSHAFNRQQVWDQSRQHEILLTEDELPELQEIINQIKEEFITHFENGFIAESTIKLQKIYAYYAAFYGLNDYPFKKCNAPWVSTVIEADGTVRPCFFHKSFGNIHQNSLEKILNSEAAISFRKTLNTSANSTCLKCVCYINLPPGTKPV